MSSYQFLEVIDEDGIRTITLNRPKVLNALNSEMRDELRHLIDGCSVEPDLRVLILTGAGRGFCSGEDVRGMDELREMGTRMFRATSRRIHDVFDTIEALEIPVIAAIEGVAAGGGMELALSCDFRVVGSGARLVMPEGNVGLIPGSGGCSRLIRYIGLGRAKELVMLGSELNGEEAHELGLATTVVPDGRVLTAAKQLAEGLKAKAPLALGMAKLVMNTCTDVDGETGRRLERLGQSVLKLSSDHMEGVAAFREKRTAKWMAR